MDTTKNAGIDWNAELRSQLEWHWTNQLRPRLAGLTDAEYFWEPVPGCWNLRPRGESAAPIAVGNAEYTIDFAIPEPTPTPVTTIAWRIGHLIAGVFGARNAVHFDGPAMDHQNHTYAATANEALDQLDAGYTHWIDGVARLGQDGLTKPCGSAEGPFADWSMAGLVLHIHREVLHHGAEIALLRDLYAWRTR